MKRSFDAMPLRAFALLLLTALAYAPALRAGFIWHDSEYILENRHLDAAAGLARFWLQPGATPQYAPLTFTTFWLEHQLWGKSPAGYHAVNVALHGLAALALWRLVRRLRVPGAYLAAALFALHPIAVESVASISERGNVLSTLLALIAADAALTWFVVRNAQFSPRAAEYFDVGQRNPDARAQLMLALVAYAAALLSRSAVCTLPIVLLILIWLQTGRLAARDILDFAPFFTLSVIAVVIIHLETPHIAALGPDFAFAPIDRILIAGRAACFYVAKLLWPAPLVLIYPRWTINSSDPAQWLYPLAVVAVLAACVAARDRIGRSPLAAVLSYLVLLAPALGFVNIKFMQISFVADRFAYLPAIPLLALAAAAMAIAAERIRNAFSIRQSHLAIGATACAVLTLLTYRQARLYAAPERLWSHVLVHNPLCPVAQAALGFAVQQRGTCDAAID